MIGSPSLRRLFSNKELDELYLSVIFSSFGVSLIHVFVPIFLLQQGYALREVVLFYIIANVVLVLFAYPGVQIAATKGCKHLILLSIPYLILFYFLLYSLPDFGWPLWLLALAQGMNRGFYWVGYHIDFSHNGTTKRNGSELSIARMSRTLAAALGPVAGGVLLVLAGFKAVFLFASIFLALSALPLFYSKDVHEPFSLQRGKCIFRSGWVKDALALAGFGMEVEMGLIFWPVMIYFFIVQDYVVLGFATSLMVLFSVLFAFLVGRWTDHHRLRTLRIGAALNIVLWLVRFFVRTGVQVFAVNAAYGALQNTMHIPMDARTYDQARKSDIAAYVLFREIALHGGSLVFLIALYILNDLYAGVWLASLGSLLMIL